KLVDVTASMAAYQELYARVEQRLRPEDRPLLRELFEAISRHHERYEHAAYLVGLRAGAGRLSGLPALTDDRSGDNEPEGACRAISPGRDRPAAIPARAVRGEPPRPAPASRRACRSSRPGRARR